MGGFGRIAPVPVDTPREVESVRGVKVKIEEPVMAVAGRELLIPPVPVPQIEDEERGAG